MSEFVDYFQSERLTVGKWRLSQADAAFEIYGDSRVTQFLGSGTPEPSTESVRTKLRDIIERNERFEHRMGSWPLFERVSNRLIGAILLKPLPESELVEVGWHLGHFAWGLGYATEAGLQICNYGFSFLGLETINAVVKPQNTASIRVTKRLGMLHVGQTNLYYNTRLELFELKQDQLIQPTYPR